MNVKFKHTGFGEVPFDKYSDGTVIFERWWDEDIEDYRFSVYVFSTYDGEKYLENRDAQRVLLSKEETRDFEDWSVLEVEG